MRVPRPPQHQGFRRSAIIFLIFGLVNIPLPEPDYHNVRHHDAPGQVCEHHDHLLRWHPGAGLADDVAILHWHWFLPQAVNADSAPIPTGPAVHAHVGDWLGSSWDDGPRVLPDDSARLIGRLASGSQAALSLDLHAGGMGSAPATGPYGSLAFRTPAARRAPLNSMLQRWVC